MIYCKKTEPFACEIGHDGGMDDILDELAVLLEQIHRAYQDEDPEGALKFRTYVQELVEGGQLWGAEANRDTTAAHYERLCRAAEHFGLEAQKQKVKEEMTELAVLLRDYQMPDKLLRGHRIEEIADVYNMLDQLCILWNCEDEVQDVAEQKMIRTMERIESGYYNET